MNSTLLHCLFEFRFKIIITFLYIAAKIGIRYLFLSQTIYNIHSINIPHTDLQIIIFNQSHP